MNENKRIVQDIVPGDRRTIRNLYVNRINTKPIRSEKIERKEVVLKDEDVEEFPEIKREHGNKNKKVIGTLFTFLIIFIGVAIIATASSLLYLKAIITIIPRTAEININGTFTANKNAKFPDLAYEVILATSTMNQTVPATDGPMVSTKASGTVNIYNEQLTGQTLIAGTRLSNIPSIVYRTTSAIVIPKARTVNGELIPGIASVKVIASEAGDSYNTKINDSILNVVAFKGTTRYNQVYAKMKTDILGGFQGNKKIISADIEKANIDSMKDNLKTKLEEQIKNLIPNDYTMPNNAYTIEYDIPNPIRKDADYAILSVKATIYGLIFKNNSFIKTIAEKDINKFPSTEYDITGLPDLNFSIINQKDFNPRISSPLNFMIKGKVNITGKFDKEDLRNKLKGTKLSESSSVFSLYPSIDNAYSRITPFWMRSFPNNTKDITIDIKH